MTFSPLSQASQEVWERSVRTNAELAEPDELPLNFIQVGDTRVAYRDVPLEVSEGASETLSGERGNGEVTFVLLHGLAGSSGNWDGVVPFLRTHGRVVIPDLPGFGFTGGDVHTARVRPMADLVAAFLAELHAGPVVLVGNSMGGMVAAHVAARRPELVDRLVLIDPVLPLRPTALPAWRVLATFTIYFIAPLGRRVVPWYVGRIGLERTGIEGVLGQVHDPLRVPKWIVRRAVAETIRHAQDEYAAATIVSAAQSLVLELLRPAYRRLLRSLTRPVTLIHGEQDALVTYSSARALADTHPSWRCVPGHDLGHVPMFEAAEWVAHEISVAP